MKSVKELTNTEILTEAARRPPRYDGAELLRESAERFLLYVGHGDLPEYDTRRDIPQPDREPEPEDDTAYIDYDREPGEPEGFGGEKIHIPSVDEIRGH